MTRDSRRGPDPVTAALMVADQHSRLRVMQYRGDLAATGTCADADNDGAAAFDGDKQDVDCGGVAVPHCDPITSLNTGAGQLSSQSGCSVVEFTSRERHSGVIDVGEAVRALPGVAGYRVG